MPPKRGSKKGHGPRAKQGASQARAAPAEPGASSSPTTQIARKTARADRQAEILEVEASIAAVDATTAVKRSEPEPSPSAADLQATLQRRQKLSEELQAVEKQIYDLETRYLENSHPLGNAIKGYEGLLTQSQAGGRRILVKQEDRLFSNSSATGVPR